MTETVRVEAELRVNGILVLGSIDKLIEEARNHTGIRSDGDADLINRLAATLERIQQHFDTRGKP